MDIVLILCMQKNEKRWIKLESKKICLRVIYKLFSYYKNLNIFGEVGELKVNILYNTKIHYNTFFKNTFLISFYIFKNIS